MNEQPKDIRPGVVPLNPEKFRHPEHTADGEPRAKVSLRALETVWINTGSLCNITCVNCYIESSPRNDRLTYFPLGDALAVYDDIVAGGFDTREIAFTGGEPFMNPDMLAMAEAALARGFSVLILTNAMQPMQRSAIREGLTGLRNRFGDRLKLRVSLDHYSQVLHEAERGPRTWEMTLAGIDWLADKGFCLAIAGRTCWGESEADERAGYAALFAQHGWPVDARDPGQLVLFPEMDASADVPEITTACWDILGKQPDDLMCASSRMVVKRKGEGSPAIVPCTLLPYDKAFEMGSSLSEMLTANSGNFNNGDVRLNHPHCARFCVLGGASCSR